jgi:hypothetical protein
MRFDSQGVRGFDGFRLRLDDEKKFGASIPSRRKQPTRNGFDFRSQKMTEKMVQFSVKKDQETDQQTDQRADQQTDQPPDQPK